MDDRHVDDLVPVGSKLRRQRGSMMRESASAPVSGFARAQLERMGWTEGTGLGKRQDGVTTHIKVKQRKEASGLGSEKLVLEQQKEAQEAWWMDALGSTLAKLGGGGNKMAQRRVTDEELFAATGGARFGMRAGKTRNLDKWKRVDDHPANATATAASRNTCTNTKIVPTYSTAKNNISSSCSTPLDGADDAVNQHQLTLTQTKKRKSRDSSSEDVENIVSVLDDENQKRKKSHKRSKKDKKSKREKKVKKDKKREKRER